MGKIKTPWDGHYLLPAFLGCVSYAASQPSIVAAFRSQTGCTWEPGKTSIERMVDVATGRELQVIQQFVDWVADTMFGTPEEVSDDGSG